MQLRLPEEKLGRLKESVTAWRRRKCCTKRDLLSLIGTLQHAAKIIRPGCSFIQKMIDLSTVCSHMNATLRLNREFHSDLEWWYQLATVWNGVSILSPVRSLASDGLVTSDAGAVKPFMSNIGSNCIGTSSLHPGTSPPRNYCQS